MSEKTSLKLFVWENVLEDYTYGMAIATAESFDEAIDLITEEMGRGRSADALEARENLKNMHPEFWNPNNYKVYPITKDLRIAAYVYGGG